MKSLLVVIAITAATSIAFGNNENTQVTSSKVLGHTWKNNQCFLNLENSEQPQEVYVKSWEDCLSIEEYNLDASLSIYQSPTDPLRPYVLIPPGYPGQYENYGYGQYENYDPCKTVYGTDFRLVGTDSKGQMWCTFVNRSQYGQYEKNHDPCKTVYGADYWLVTTDYSKGQMSCAFLNRGQ